MALQNTRLTEIAYVPSSVGSIYSNPNLTKTFVRGIILHNTNTTIETVVLHWVPDSSGSLGTAGSATRFLKIALVADETFIFEVPFSLVLLDHNESIQAVTTTANKVNVIVTGDTDT